MTLKILMQTLRKILIVFAILTFFVNDTPLRIKGIGDMYEEN